MFEKRRAEPTAEAHPKLRLRSLLPEDTKTAFTALHALSVKLSVKVLPELFEVVTEYVRLIFVQRVTKRIFRGA